MPLHSFTVSLVPSNNVSLCFGGSITLRCMTTEQSLLWTSNAENRLFNDINQPTTTLGNFTLNVVSVTSNGTSLSVTSTATLVNFQFTSSGLKIECKELMTLSLSMEATLIAAGKLSLFPEIPTLVLIACLSQCS